MDLDLVLRTEQPASLTDKSSIEEKQDNEKWEHSNHMSLMIMKRGIPETFRGNVSEKVTTASEFPREIEKHFVKNDKAETSTLLSNLISMKHKGVHLRDVKYCFKT